VTETKLRPFFGVTPKQGVVIAGLAGVLGFLFINQDHPTGEQSSDAMTAAEAPRTSSRNAAAKSPTWTPKWPEVAFDEAVGHNPFAPLTVSSESAPLATDQALIATQEAGAGMDSLPEDGVGDEAAADAVAEFQSRGVSMIFRNKQKTCALIGDRVVQEGDVVDGVRIVAITTTEVIVEPAKTP
jgi:hypothetical protein